jgi:hypothetical protein
MSRNQVTPRRRHQSSRHGGPNDLQACQRKAESNPLLRAALDLGERGWRVVPIPEGEKGPRLPEWQRKATDDRRTICQWWREAPRGNVGLVLGPQPSGEYLLALDVDGPEGEDALRRRQAEHGDLPETRESRTGREDGGRHLLFTAPLDTRIAQRPSALGNHLDAWGEGHQIVVPPSLHPSGRHYTWTSGGDPAPAPEWLLARLAPTAPVERLAAAAGATSAADGEPITDGKRNATLTSLAGSMRRRGMGQEAITAALLAENADRCVPPLAEGEVRGIAASVARYEPAGAGEGKAPRGPSQATQLVQMATERYDFGISTTGMPFLVPKRGPRVARALKGGRPSLEEELAADFYGARGSAPSSSATTEAIRVLHGLAQRQAPAELANRVGATADGALVLDLGGPDGRAVVVDVDGWRVVDSSPVLFRRTNSTLPLPEPARGGDLTPLRRLLNVSDEQFDVVVAWLAAALVPNIPHAILVLAGEQGTAKTNATRMLASILDPRSAQTMGLPTGARDWVDAASKRHVVAFDNASHIEPWLNDALSRGATGEGWVARSLYTNDDEFVFQFRNVIILNGIALSGIRGDLLERMVTVDLEPIPREKRRPETGVVPALADGAIVTEFRNNHAGILGGLLDLASKVLGVLPTIRLTELPRMADFAYVVAAVDRVRGTSALETYNRVAADVNAELVASDPVATALVGYLDGYGAFDGTVAELLDALNAWQRDQNEDWKPRKPWPIMPHNLSAAIRRLAPALRGQGVSVDGPRHTNRGAVVAIRLSGDAEGDAGDAEVTLWPEPASPLLPAESDAGDAGDAVPATSLGHIEKPSNVTSPQGDGMPRETGRTSVTSVTSPSAGGVPAGQGGNGRVTLRQQRSVTAASPRGGSVTLCPVVCERCGESNAFSDPTLDHLRHADCGGRWLWTDAPTARANPCTRGASNGGRPDVHPVAETAA